MSKVEEYAAFLDTIHLFQGIKDDHIFDIAENLEERHYPAGTTILLKGEPAINFSLIYSDISAPASTPRAEATTSAAEAARNTVYLLTSLSVANSMVANWVLSPSSAINTAPNTVRNTFHSIAQ